MQPTMVEFSLQRTPLHSRLSDHLMMHYKVALLAVMAAQFDERGYPDGMFVRLCLLHALFRGDCSCPVCTPQIQLTSCVVLPCF